MKKIIIILIICLSNSQQFLDEIKEIKAPFEMPQLQRPIFPNRNINIIKTGAKQNKLSTSAIQKAIDQLYKNGGGTVIIPSGQWLSGRIELILLEF